MLVILCPVLIREKVVTNILPIVYLLPILYGIKSLPVKMFPKTATKEFSEIVLQQSWSKILKNKK